MEKQEMEAFLDFVRDNPNGLKGVDEATAKYAVLVLSENMDPKDLFDRIIKTDFADSLFHSLLDLIMTGEKDRQEKRLALLDAVMGATDRIWRDVILHPSVAKRFTTAKDFDHLLKRHKDKLFNEEHGLYRAFSSEEYWRHRVRWYIVKHDFRRARDEIKKAARGFFHGMLEERPFFGIITPACYHYAVSREVQEELLGELFQAMVNKSVFPRSIGPGTNSTAKELLMSAYFRKQKNKDRRRRVEARVARYH